MAAIQPTNRVAKITVKFDREDFIPNWRVRAFPTKYCEIKLAARGITRPQPTPSRQLSNINSIMLSAKK